MASIIRTTLSWERALLSGAFLAILTGLMLPVMYPALLNDLVQAGVEVYEQYNTEMARALGGELEQVIRDTMNASMAGTYFATAIGMTMLARSWQGGNSMASGYRRR